MTLCCSSSQVMRPGSIPLAPVGDPPPYPPHNCHRLTPKHEISRTAVPNVQEDQNKAQPILEFLDYSADIKLGNSLRYKNPRTRRWYWKHFCTQEGSSQRLARMRVWKPKHAPTLMPSPAEDVSDGDPEWLLVELSRATDATHERVQKPSHQSNIVKSNRSHVISASAAQPQWLDTKYLAKSRALPSRGKNHKPAIGGYI